MHVEIDRDAAEATVYIWDHGGFEERTILVPLAEPTEFKVTTVTLT